MTDFPQPDLDAIADPEIRALVAWCLNQVQELRAANQALQAQIQRLQDEILRLKGEQPSRSKAPKDGSRGGGSAPAPPHSSEAARKPNRPSGRGKDKRNLRRTLPVDAEHCLRVSAEALPSDAVFKGCVPAVVQELVCVRRTVRYLRQKWYSPSTGRTYLAPLPPGCRRGYGPGLQALLLELNYGANVTVPQLLDWLTRRGIIIAKGTLVGLLTQPGAAFHAEAAAVLEAGLRSTPWQQVDVTATPVDGAWHACHVLGGPSYRYYRTVPGQSRLDLLGTLQGGRPLRHRRDETVFLRLTAAGVGPRVQAQLRGLSGGPEWDPATLTARLAETRPRLGRDTRELILEATALAAYRADSEWPAVTCLLGDDAAQFRELTPELALCWVHDARHYQKLTPAFTCFRQEVEAFQARYWTFYRRLAAYRESPSAAEAAVLRTEFDRLFQAGQYHYADLERCITRTRENRTKLLLVLKHPELPLHNNDSELAARRRVIKRRVSHGPQSRAGAQAWDTFHTLAATTAKLGTSFAAYLEDRLSEGVSVPWLPELIAQRAAEQNLGASWT